jgi:hypothetical protein
MIAVRRDFDRCRPLHQLLAGRRARRTQQPTASSAALVGSGVAKKKGQAKKKAKKMGHPRFRSLAPIIVKILDVVMSPYHRCPLQLSLIHNTSPAFAGARARVSFSAEPDWDSLGFFGQGVPNVWPQTP